MSKGNSPPRDAAKKANQTTSEGPDYLAALGPPSLRFVDERHQAASTLSPSVQGRIKRIVERIQVGDAAEGEAAVHELLEIVDDRLDDVIQGRDDSPPAQSMRQRLAELDTHQGVYLTASGTLTQFNAISPRSTGLQLRPSR